jgi:hypothetical protein
VSTRDSLVQAYLAALEIRALMVFAVDGKQPSKISTDQEKNVVLVDALWFAKPQHAELVLSHTLTDLEAIGATRPEGWIDMPGREVRDTLANVAGYLGASFRSANEVSRDAQNAVARITRDVEEARRKGELKQVNAEYKLYRQRQAQRGEKAIPYSAHLANFTRGLVILAAQNVRPG